MSMEANQICFIPKEIFYKVQKTQGDFFKAISKFNPDKIAEDLLNPVKALNQADILLQYTDINDKKVLEIGSGLGINHIVWTKKYHIQGYGIEPDSSGFESSYNLSKQLIQQNNLNLNRIIDAKGEKLPFENDFFDIVYSTNVLEHVLNPSKVLEEAIRVLKPFGIMQIVFPNYHSYFDGHYAVFHPPILFKGFFTWYVKSIWHRNPEFAKTLNTELNVIWTKKQLNHLRQKYSFEVLSLGDDIFFQRMQTLSFSTWAGLTKVKNALSLFNRLGINKIVAKIILFLKGWSPIILTIRKLPNA